MPAKDDKDRAGRSKLGWEAWTGLALILGLLGGTAAWASYATLSGAVIASGAVVVESYGKRIQHADGGIVAEIHVEDGREVKEGELLLRLDDTINRTNFTIAEKSLDQALARLARLEAERDEKPSITFPSELLSRRSTDHVQKAIEGETAIFEAMGHIFDGKKDQLTARRAQLSEEARGYEAQLAARRSEILLLKREMAGTKSLVARGYAPVVKMLAEQRQLASLEGEAGRLSAQMAQSRGRIGEIDLQIVQIDDDETRRIANEIRDTERRIDELREKKVVAEDKLRRVDIRAPRSGFVHELQVHTIGAVVRSGETVLTIVPKEDGLVIEARVRPIEIDKVFAGQKAILRFPNFNRRTTPELAGRVVRVGADVAQDIRAGGQSSPDVLRRDVYYPVRILTAEQELRRLEGIRLLPGMPVEVFVQTEERTAMSYLLKPITDQLARALREK